MRGLKTNIGISLSYAWVVCGVSYSLEQVDCI